MCITPSKESGNEAVPESGAERHRGWQLVVSRRRPTWWPPPTLTRYMSWRLEAYTKPGCRSMRCAPGPAAELSLSGPYRTCDSSTVASARCSSSSLADNGTRLGRYIITPRRRGMAKTFPEVQPGGSLILAWQIKDKKVLVVGGGEVCMQSPAEPSRARHQAWKS